MKSQNIPIGIEAAEPGNQPVSLPTDEEKAALSIIAKDYGDRLLSWTGVIVGPNYAEDAAQETLIRALTGIRNYDRSKAAISTWLHTIATNTSLQMLRDEGRRPSKSETELDFMPDKSDHSDPVDTVLSGMIINSLIELSGDYSNESRRAVLKMLIEGSGIEETARQLGMTKGAVKTMASRVRSDAKKRIAEDFGISSLADAA